MSAVWWLAVREDVGAGLEAKERALVVLGAR